MDWYNVYGITPEQADYLSRLDLLRSEEPILWALIQGQLTSDTIAKYIAWPHDYVLGRLRIMKKEGLVWDSEAKAGIVWHIVEGAEYHELRLWVLAQKRAGGLFRRKDRNDE